jgi:hypothetical protein
MHTLRSRLCQMSKCLLDTYLRSFLFTEHEDCTSVQSDLLLRVHVSYAFGDFGANGVME